MTQSSATGRTPDTDGHEGLTPGKDIPHQLATLASQTDLGKLQSVHRPTKWYCRIQYRGGVFFVFDHGVVLSQWRGRKLLPFRDGECQIKMSGGPKNKIFLLYGPGGRAGCWSSWWSDSQLLAQAFERLAARNPLTQHR